MEAAKRAIATAESKLAYYPTVIRGGHLRSKNCGTTISLAIALAPQLFFNGCANAAPQVF